MTTAQEIPWARTSIEGVAIVASILLAFAIDAWWDERQDRVSEHQELLRLQAEFQLNRERNPGSTGSQGRARDSTQAIYETLITARENGLDSVDIPRRLLDGLVATPTFEIETPVLDGLVRSGRIEVIKSNEILEALSLWERAVRNSNDMELRSRDFFDDHLTSALNDNAGMHEVFAGHRRILSSAPGYGNHNLNSDAFVMISTNPQLIGLVAQRLFLTTAAVRTLEEITRADEQVLTAIQHSLVQ